MRCYSVRWLTAGLCRPLRTAKPLPSATVGKLTKLVSLPGSTVACHVASLPSAADGKEPFAVGGRRQRACILSLFSIFLIQKFSQQIYMTYIDIFPYHISSTQVSYHISHITSVSSIHIVHLYKRKTGRENKHSINASFREVNEICKMGNKKVRRRRLEEEEENEEEEEVYDIYELT